MAEQDSRTCLSNADTGIKLNNSTIAKASDDGNAWESDIEVSLRRTTVHMEGWKEEVEFLPAAEHITISERLVFEPVVLHLVLRLKEESE